MIKTFDLFAGIGGFRYASEKVFKKNKIENLCVGWSEIDKYCQITYKSNYNLDNTYFIDDIKKITGNNNNFCNQNNYNSLKKKFLLKIIYVILIFYLQGFHVNLLALWENNKV